MGWLDIDRINMCEKVCQRRIKGRGSSSDVEWCRQECLDAIAEAEGRLRDLAGSDNTVVVEFNDWLYMLVEAKDVESAITYYKKILSQECPCLGSHIDEIKIRYRVLPEEEAELNRKADLVVKLD